MTRGDEYEKNDHFCRELLHLLFSCSMDFRIHTNIDVCTFNRRRRANSSIVWSRFNTICVRFILCNLSISNIKSNWEKDYGGCLIEKPRRSELGGFSYERERHGG